MKKRDIRKGVKLERVGTSNLNHFWVGQIMEGGF